MALQSPIGYSGPATDAERLVTPECKVVRKFGQEVEITLYGGDDNAPIRFDSEAHLFAAMLTNKTFDVHLRGAKCAALGAWGGLCACQRVQGVPSKQRWDLGTGSGRVQSLLCGAH